MKLTHFILALVVSCPLTALAQPVKPQNLQVPFYDIAVKPGTDISADYDFDPAHQILVCSNTAAGYSVFSWQYKDGHFSGILAPYNHIALKDHSYFEGHYADPKGTINISYSTNNTHEEKVLVSCEYHTWG